MKLAGRFKPTDRNFTLHERDDEMTSGNSSVTHRKSCRSFMQFNLQIHSFLCKASFNPIQTSSKAYILHSPQPRITSQPSYRTMLPSAKRTFLFLLRTPLVPPPPPTPAFELTTFSNSPRPTAGPSRPCAASRAISSLSTGHGAGYGNGRVRGYASDHGKKELYSDEAGSTGAGVSVVIRSHSP